MDHAVSLLMNACCRRKELRIFITLPDRRQWVVFFGVFFLIIRQAQEGKTGAV
jgi:hypothetical protein